jgi:hypothetical protein
MYQTDNYVETMFHYERKGLSFKNVKVRTLREFDERRQTEFLYECFTATLSGLNESDKVKVFKGAAASGYYLIPIAERVVVSQQTMKSSIQSLFAWIPTDLIQTVGAYLGELEKLAKTSYAFYQEDEGVMNVTKDFGSLIENFKQFESIRKTLFDSTCHGHNQTEMERSLFLSHCKGETKDSLSYLMLWMDRLEQHWSDLYPSWAEWQADLQKRWHVSSKTGSPYQNLKQAITDMYEQEKQQRLLPGV